MSAPSRIPSPTKGIKVIEGKSTIPAISKSTSTSQGRFQARLNNRDLISLRSTSDLSLRTPTSGRPEISTANGASRTGSAHARSSSTATTGKAPSPKESLSEASGSLDGAHVSTNRSHNRTLSESTATRSTAPGRHTAEASTKLTGSLPRSNANTNTLIDATLKKPTFNTYKQQFSPKKPKPPPPLSSVSVLTSSPIAATETPLQASRVYDEVLQLSVLLQHSTATLRQFEDSIRRDLKAEYADLEVQKRHVESAERDRQARNNVQSLVKWMHQGLEGKKAEVDRLSLLAHCMQELYGISRRDGPFLTAMEEFDEWQTRAKIAEASRKNAEDIGLWFTAPINPQWSTLISSLRDRVRVCADTLKNLGGATESSSVGVMIRAFSVLAEHFSQEIAACKDVEGLILRQEQNWIESSLTLALSAVQTNLSPSEQMRVRQGIWEQREQKAVA